MPDSHPPDPLLPPTDDDKSARTLRRILIEALFVGLIGGSVLGIAWDIGRPDAGLVLAILIWVAGPPLLEILRLRSPR